MGNSIARIDSVFVPVTDMARSEAWYTRLLGMKVGFRSSDGRYIGLFFVDGPKPSTALTIYKVDQVPKSDHIAFNFYTTDVDASFAHFRENGAWTTEIESGDGMSFFDAKDPDGNMVGVVWFPE